MDGVLGGGDVAGDLTRLWPFLELGQWAGVGSSTSHGFGCYRLEHLNPEEIAGSAPVHA